MMNLKGHILGIIIIFAGHSGITQSVRQKAYGGLGNERGHAIVVTTDGRYAIAGHTDSFGAGEDDLFILKVSGDGTPEWQYTFGGLRDDNGLSIALKETADAGFVLTGSTASYGNTPSDLYILKVNATGNLLWDYRYDSGPAGNGKDHGRGLLICSNNDILVLGTDDSNSFGSNDGLILRIADDGTLRWKKIYGGNANDHLHEAIELPGGNFLVCGSSQSFGPGNTAGYLLKLNKDGNVIWSKTYGGSELEGFSACDRASDQGIIATGITTSYGNGQSDVLLCKIDSAGTLQWTKTFGGSDGERGASVKTLKDNSGYLVVAFTDSYGNGDRDILVICTNLTGEITWSKTFGTQGFEGVDLWSNCTLALDGGNTFALTGWSDSLTVGGEDVLFIKGNESGDMLCQGVNVTTLSPTMSTENPVTQVISVGVYAPITSTVKEIAMTESHLCYCIPDSLCDPCSVFTTAIESTGHLSCELDTVQLAVYIGESRPDLTYYWMNSDEVILAQDSAIKITVPGLYILLAVDTTLGCQARDSQLVMDITSIPPCDAGADRVLDCNHGSIELEANANMEVSGVTYHWNGAQGGMISDPFSRVITVSAAGQYILTVLDTVNACMNVDTVTVIDQRTPPIADAGPAQVLECSAAPVTLDGALSSVGPDFIHVWNGPGIFNFTGLMLDINAGGWYYLLVTNILTGCIAMDSVEVIATGLLSGAEILVLDPVCAGDANGEILVQTPIGGTPPYEYALNGDTYQSSPLFSGLSAGSYDLSILDSSQCTWNSIVTIGEGNEISLELGADLLVQAGASVTLSASVESTGVVDSLIWQPAEILSCTHCLHPSVNTLHADTFYVHEIVYSEGCFAVDTIWIRVYDAPVIFVPNIFSPNQDGTNDRVTLFCNDGNAQVLEFEIYDRWGEVVFRRSTFPVNVIELGWDGYFHDQLMDPGLFIFSARIQLQDGTLVLLSGEISLVR